jgi:hypothetical protein
MAGKHPIDLRKSHADPIELPFCSIDDLLASANKISRESPVGKGHPERWRRVSSALADIRMYAPILNVFTEGQPGAFTVPYGMVRIVIEVSRCLKLSRLSD